MPDSTAIYHVEFIGSNLGLELDPLAKADEIEEILNEQWSNGYEYEDLATVRQANEKEYTFMIFKERITTSDAIVVRKRRLRRKRF